MHPQTVLSSELIELLFTSWLHSGTHNCYEGNHVTPRLEQGDPAPRPLPSSWNCVTSVFCRIFSRSYKLWNHFPVSFRVALPGYVFGFCVDNGEFVTAVLWGLVCVK
ncbi:unnamed protein product [Pleuronectes platessa]|uniref:Uncharacterized protein n=1 Tax=Pleuronectes platessa TaxID=8262 RepID=A0A9N7TGA6_PLEPL|nr:unnamed protein product [Pleuronectes platessa]